MAEMQPVFSSTLDSRIEAADDAEEAVHRIARAAGFPESDYYFIGLAVREVAMNAVKHGNRFDPQKKVELKIFFENHELAIEITDEGEGFNLEDIPDPLAPENRERGSGRGVLIARNTMDEFRVIRSREGTRVRIVKRLPPTACPSP